MDFVFWLGLGLGALISFPISIVANLSTDRFRELLQKRHTIKLSRKRSKEVRKYVYIRYLVAANPAAQILLDLDIFIAHRVTSWRNGMFLLAIGFAFVAYRLDHPYRIYVAVAALLTILAALVVHFVSVSYESYLFDVRQKILQFSEYENRIREEWGDDALEEFLEQAQQGKQLGRLAPLF